MSRFYSALLQRNARSRSLPILGLSALLLCAGIGGMASAQKSSRQRAQGASVGGYTLVTGVSIMVPPCGPSGGKIEGTVSLSGSGDKAVTVSIGGPGATASSCSLIPGQSCGFIGTLPTAIGTQATYTATVTGRSSQGGPEQTFTKEAKSTVGKKQWTPDPAPVQLRLYSRTVGPSQGGKNADGTYGYAPGAPVLVYVDQMDVQGVEDKDTCKVCDKVQPTQEADELTYTWSSTGGDGPQTGPIASNGQNLTMPTQIGATLTITVVIDDKAQIDPATEEGSRKDGPQTLQVTLITREQTGGGGGGGGPTLPNPTPTPVTPPVVPPVPGPNPIPTPTPAVPPTPQPIGLTATATSPTKIELSWSGAAGRLYRSLELGFTPGETTLLPRGTDETDEMKTSYTDTGRTPKTLYYYALVPYGKPELTEGRDQAETPDEESPSVTFINQSARACAGGIAGDTVHTFTITGVAKRKDENGIEQIVPNGTKFELSFENNRGHDYGDGRAQKKAKFVPNSTTAHPQTIVPGSDNEQMTVTADDKGEFKLSVLSSDIISTDIEVKIKWKNAKGEAKDVGSKACDFCVAKSRRNFLNSFAPDEEDKGWLFSSPNVVNIPTLVNPNAITAAKVYIKSESQNWAEVNGHSLLFYVVKVVLNDGSSTVVDDEEQLKDYAMIIDRADAPVPTMTTVTKVTSSDGAAQVWVRAGSEIKSVARIHIGASDLSQWRQ